MKQPVEWHERGLANLRTYLAGQVEHLAAVQANVARLQSDVNYLAAQIKEAKRRGMTAFDDAKLLRPRKEKGAP